VLKSGCTVYSVNRGQVGLSKHNCHRILFIGLTMTTCFGQAWPSSGHKVSYKLQGENVYLYMNETYLEVVGIHRDQRDLVNRFLYIASGAYTPKRIKVRD
jgi:hypothetical protein